MLNVNLISVRQALEAKRKELEGRRCRREDILIEVTADELDRMQQTVNREVAISNNFWTAFDRKIARTWMTWRAFRCQTNKTEIRIKRATPVKQSFV